MWVRSTGVRVVAGLVVLACGLRRNLVEQSGSGGQSDAASRPGVDRGGRRAGPGGSHAQGLLEARMVRGGLSQCRPALGSAGP